MTTTTVPAPGAVININLSSAAVANVGPLFNQALGTHLQTILSLQKQDVLAITSGGKQISGGALSFKSADGHVIQLNGNKVEKLDNDKSGVYEGAVATSRMTVGMSSVDTSSTKGDMLYSYQRSGSDISSAYIVGKISSYQHRSLDPASESSFGSVVTGFTGNLEVTAQSQNFSINGKINALNFGGSKLLKSATLKGDLNIDNDNGGPTGSMNISAEGSISGYNASFYDGSKISIKTGVPVTFNQQLSVLGTLANADLWRGNDSVTIVLPNDMANLTNVNTGDGNDTVTAKGGGGKLRIDTGAGDDQITLLDDQPNIIAGAGTDTLRSSFENVNMFSGLENFIFTGKTAVAVQGNELDNQITGGKRADQIRGGLGSDTLYGLAGNDWLFGNEGGDQLFGGAGNDSLAGNEGADTMYGGAGNDLYLIEAGDSVSESRSPTNAADAGGIDTVQSSADHTLGAYFENLQLTDDALNGQGNVLANIITGNEKNNALKGEAGNDKLWGGNGNDGLFGGDGSDTLWGEDGKDRLDGGAGSDTMWGGSGDDTYVVDNARDRISEAVSANDASDAGGRDTVETSLSYVLAQGLEDLLLLGQTSINGTGNNAANVITGNSGDNIIDGKGGVDSLNGGNGSDIYLIASAEEHSAAEISDKGSEGVDEVRFSPTAPKPIPGTQAVIPTLKLFQRDEGIERVSIGTGTGKLAVTSGKIAANIDASEVNNGLTIVGNAGSNKLTGTVLGDILIGNGGNDVLIGGAGGDKFVFAMSPNAKTDVDTITDFKTGEDQLVFLRSKFAGIGPVGNLSESAFYSGNGVTKAHDADDRFVYDSQNGNLYFDRDGTGSSAATLIGVLTPGTQLSATDCKIVDII